VLRALAGAAAALGLLARAGGEEAAAHDAKARCRNIEDPQKRKKCLERAKRHNRTHRTTTTTTTGTPTTTTTAGTPTTTTTRSGPTGSLRLCKVAGAGVGEGRDFTFTTSDARTIVVPAGSAANPTCVVREFAPGQLLIRETIPTGNRVTSIIVAPDAARVGPPDLAAGTVTVRIAVNAEVRVTYTNAAS
jgi:hypothetical protein